MNDSSSSAELVALLAERILALRPGHPVRVGIDGRSAAGKSTFACALADGIRMAGRTCYVCDLDDFHPPGHKHRAAAGYFDSLEKYLAEGYDFASFRQLAIDPAGPSGSRRCRLAMWRSFEDEPYPEQWVRLDEDAVLVAEGGFLLLPELRQLWDFSIWLDIDTQTLLDRVARRDVWIGDADQIWDSYRGGWIPRHERYEALHRPQARADAVVDNRQPDHPRLTRLVPPPAS